jgi:hypothetical protein
MAKAARDIIAIPSAEVDVERLFSGCRDVLGIWRQSMKEQTMRTLMLLRDCYS